MANPQHVGPFVKPSRLAAPLRKLSRQQARRRNERRDRIAAIEAERVIREQVWMRDKSRCRACQRQVLFHSDHALNRGHVHHVIYRSAGGETVLLNLCLLCAFCHDEEHRHILRIEGNPNRALTLTHYDTKGNVRSVALSPNPSEAR